jgi:ABC-type cobalt transport system substrate-binding protein
MAIIFGFDLSEMSCNAFNHRKMFDKRWHLRRERLICYQLAMIISLAAECTATYSMSRYQSHQSRIEALSGYTAHVHNNDIIAAACTTIVFSVLVATLFGADFFFLVFWPRRLYPQWYNITREMLAVVITLGMAASSLMTTVVVAKHAEYITGVDGATVQALLAVHHRPPLIYRHFRQNIAWVVLIWIAFLSTVVATAIMFISVAHDTKYGTAPKEVEEIRSDTKRRRNNQAFPDARTHSNETSAPKVG